LTLPEKIKNRLHKAERVVVVGVGSEMRGDDIVGLLVLEELKKDPHPKVILIEGGTAPENFTGQIKKAKPTHLIIVDAADLRQAPGTIEVIDPERIGGYSFSTHALPLKIMVDFILADWKCEVMVIAIQPQSLEFGRPVDPAVAEAAHLIAEAIISSFPPR